MRVYQAKMLPQVDYQKIESSVSFSLLDLEHGTIQDCCDFLNSLKPALIKEYLIQMHELGVAHLCAYLGAAVTVHTVHEAEKLESPIIQLIKDQSHTAYHYFNQYPINGTIKNHEQKIKNVEILRKSAPGSIIVQTLRLGRVMMDMLEELKTHRQSHFKNASPPQQTELFCSQEILTKILLLVASKKCAEWRKQLDDFSDHYVINQLAIQIGWLIGYFSHLDAQSPEETKYFEYGLPLIKMYRAHIYRLMHAYASTTQKQEAPELPENPNAEALVSEIRSLSEKVHGQIPPAFNDFQKQIAITKAEIEKTLIAFIMQNHSIKVMLMSLFYFWFTLEAPLQAADPESIENEDPFLHMGAVIELVRKTVKPLPHPMLTPEINALNEKMQKLKSYLPHPEELDKDVPGNIEQQSAQINTAIHGVINEFFKQNIHLEAVTISLFYHWMRLSVFFGVSESDWQKMDFYFSDILKAVRNDLTAKWDKMYRKNPEII